MKEVGGDIRGTIETFLNVVSELETLEVELCCASSLLSPTSICRQANSLQHLEVFATERHSGEGRHKGCIHYTSSDIAFMAERLSNVEGLLLPYVDCAITDCLRNGELGAHFEALSGPRSMLRSVRTLQFFTWVRQSPRLVFGFRLIKCIA